MRTRHYTVQHYADYGITVGSVTVHHANLRWLLRGTRYYVFVSRRGKR